VRLFHVVGARPNFMKVAPVMKALRSCEHIHQELIHTGQHYDFNMSEVFFQELGIADPDLNLGVGSGTHAGQTAEIMRRLESVLINRRPDLLLVYGDVNSTLAAALVAAKVGVPVAHVEAGLRSFDRSMPEEINRVVTDQLASFLFTPSADADANLRNEGIAANKIFRVGNVMIDSLLQVLPAAQKRSRNSFEPYALVTLHRPHNVDHTELFESILESLIEISDKLRVIFPVHPRTRQRIAESGVNVGRLEFLAPLPYIDFLALQASATVVITDSGGIQEETTWLGIPCLTLRDNTERPITVSMGTNILVGSDPDNLRIEIQKILAGKPKQGRVPPLWDGHAAERIAQVLVEAVASGCHPVDCMPSGYKPEPAGRLGL
jgi:UDP-N-acetylglucosamine 2-epimerase (non-hydrolysing)